MKKKTIFVVLMLIFFSINSISGQETRLIINDVIISLINNGMALKFNNIGPGTRTVYVVIRYADNTTEVRSFSIVPDSYREQLRTRLSMRDVGALSDYLALSPAIVDLPKRATHLSQATTAQRAELEAQRQAAEQAERNQRQSEERVVIIRNLPVDQVNPIQAERHNTQGSNHNNKGNYNQAVSEYTLAIQHNPNNASYYSNRGAAYNNLGDYNRAIIDFNRAIGINSNYANPYRHRAFSYMQLGNYTQARIDINRALQIDPNYESAQTLNAELEQLGH